MFRAWNQEVYGSLAVMWRAWLLYLPLLVQSQFWNQILVSDNNFNMRSLCIRFQLNKLRKHLMWHEIALSFLPLFYHPHHNRMLCRYIYHITRAILYVNILISICYLIIWSVRQSNVMRRGQWRQTRVIALAFSILHTWLDQFVNPTRHRLVLIHVIARLPSEGFWLTT